MMWKEIPKPNNKLLPELRKHPKRLLRIPEHTYIQVDESLLVQHIFFCATAIMRR